MARSKQPAPPTATVATTFPSAEAVDIAQLVEDLDGMLSRLRLGAILRARFAVGEAPSSRLEISSCMAAGSAAQSVARPADAGSELAGAPPEMAAGSGARPGEAGHRPAGVAPAMAAKFGGGWRDARESDPNHQALSDASGGWRLERSGCLGACGHDPVLRLDEGPLVPFEAGPVVRLPLLPAASLVERLVALGLPLLPELPAPAP